MEFMTMPTFIFTIVLVCAAIMSIVLLIMDIIQYKYIKELETALVEENERANHFQNMCEKLEVKKILNDFQEH